MTKDPYPWARYRKGEAWRENVRRVRNERAERLREAWRERRLERLERHDDDEASSDDLCGND